jgi:hypothetical protein
MEAVQQDKGGSQAQARRSGPIQGPQQVGLQNGQAGHQGQARDRPDTLRLHLLDDQDPGQALYHGSILI